MFDSHTNPPLTQYVFDNINMVFVKIFKGSKHDFTNNWQYHSWLHPVLLTRSVKANVNVFNDAQY